MKSKITITLIIAAIIAAVVGLVCLVAFQPVPYAGLDPDTVIAPVKETGFIGEKVIGDPASAAVVVYEYADYGCSHCAEWNRKVDTLMAKYPDRIALVFRGYDIGQFKNSRRVAAAVTAAAMQGYFKEYKDLVYANQAEWAYADGAELTALLVQYFEAATTGSGDLTKFQDDIKSDAVKARLRFEQAMGEKVGISGTPTFRIDGAKIDLATLLDTIEQKLATQ